MSVLITGGAGFIGSHFIELLLDRGATQIVCLDNFNDYYDPAQKVANIARFFADPRVHIVRASFCDENFIDSLFAQYQFEEVVHLGAYAGVRASLDRPHIYQETNVGGTLALLEAARRHPVRRFLMASSSTVYGRGADVPFCEDSTPGVPLSPYGASKRAAELMAFTYHDLFRVPVVSLRLFSVYGPRLRPDLALTIFTSAIMRGEPLPLFGDGTIRRDFTHISDICDGIYAALKAEGVDGEAINLGHDKPIAIRDLIEQLEAAVGTKAVIDRQPEKPGEMPITHADLSKAKRLLRYEPQRDFETGLRQYVDWFLSEHRPRMAA